MQYIIIFILIIIAMVSSCARDTTSTLGITGNEFLESFNDNVSKDLTVPILSEDIYVGLGGIEGITRADNRYTIGCSYANGKLRHIALYYIYSLEPGQRPTAEGKATMEQVCIAAIDAVDDGWFTNEKDILKACGFYSNSMDSKWHEKDGICYLMFDNGICWGLQIRAVDDTEGSTSIPPIMFDVEKRKSQNTSNENSNTNDVKISNTSNTTNTTSSEIKDPIVSKTFTKPQESQPTGSEQTNRMLSEDIASNKHWIKDADTGIYLWNPEPAEGESVSWNGGYIEDGKYKYADGKGTVTWYKNGKIIQVDYGAFIHGRHNGRFVHKFPSGKETYSEWNEGVELKN